MQCAAKATIISSGSLRLTSVRIGPPTGNCFTMEHFQILDTQLRNSDLENVADDPERKLFSNVWK